MNPIKWNELNKGDKVQIDGEILAFHRVDGNCFQARDSEGFTIIVKGDDYILGDDGIYIAYSLRT